MRSPPDPVAGLASVTASAGIVAKVNELMALCDRLETSLAASDGNRSRLLDSLLAETLASAEGATAADELELAALA